MKKHIKNTVKIFAAISIVLGVYSCDDLETFEPLGANSIADATPPRANFTALQGQGIDEEWKDYTFSNVSTGATTYSWDFGDGNTSNEVDGANTYPGEGMYTIVLTASDNLGVVSTHTLTIDVVEPEPPLVPDPVLINSGFDRLAKLGSSNTCSCSGWDNDDIGEQGESSTVSGVPGFLKFDNNEPDHVYQEFAVTPNSDYTITLSTSFKSLENNVPAMDSMLELRVLTGNGYVSGYTPTYYTDAPDFPSSGYGYTTVAQTEDAANNLLIETQVNPNDDDYITYSYSFNSGANDSVALFIRGIGGSNGGSYGYNSGDEEIRVDYVTILADN